MIDLTSGFLKIILMPHLGHIRKGRDCYEYKSRGIFYWFTYRYLYHTILNPLLSECHPSATRSYKKNRWLIEMMERQEKSDETTAVPDNIIIFPPDYANAKNTDKDSGEEDNVRTNNLAGG
ncbi:hypothetical protein ILUMI_20201 [Ignelater luminosus]|uniref:Uncharacterized protein n=1 Tax=Ignelater luminosus TaxID=2038154 RepID=A0A8K0FZ54_IGNLU|nr:hypothetical protein ILUMI_20201 [Ignelater luminosus]